MTLTGDGILFQVVIPVKSSGNTWRDFLTECVQPMYQLFLILAPQLLLWKCIGVDLFLETCCGLPLQVLAFFCDLKFTRNRILKFLLPFMN